MWGETSGDPVAGAPGRREARFPVGETGLTVPPRGLRYPRGEAWLQKHSLECRGQGLGRSYGQCGGREALRALLRCQ